MKFRLEKCTECDGKKGETRVNTDTFRPDYWRPCFDCNGKGERPTSDLRDLIKFIKEWSCIIR